MLRFQAGDASAMEALFARFQKPLFNFFYRMVGRRETAEDLVQETFVKLCRFGTSFRGSEAKFSTWLYSVASNQGRDYIRHATRRPETPLGEYELSDDSPPMEARLIGLELEGRLKAAINSLPEKERVAIILREYHGLDYRAIAEALSCPLGSVKVLIFRARQRLRERLKDLKDEM
ncbi:MAG: RNA polymerase sigma factor [Armatimonadota bacterium]